MTEDAIPLGLLDQKIYQHDPTDKVSNKSRPIHEKESYSWIEALRQSSNLITNKTVVTIADRESDIFEIFFEASKLNSHILTHLTQNLNPTLTL